MTQPIRTHYRQAISKKAQIEHTTLNNAIGADYICSLPAHDGKPLEKSDCSFISGIFHSAGIKHPFSHQWKFPAKDGCNSTADEGKLSGELQTFLKSKSFACDCSAATRCKYFDVGYTFISYDGKNDSVTCSNTHIVAQQSPADYGSDHNCDTFKGTDSGLVTLVGKCPAANCSSTPSDQSHEWYIPKQ